MAKNIQDSINYSDYYLKNFRQKDKVKQSTRAYEREIVKPTQMMREDRYIIAPYVSESLRLKAIEPDEIDSEPYYPLHTVEQITRVEPRGRARRKLRTKAQSTPKSRYRNRGIVLVVLTILLCFGGTMLIADALSGGYMLNDFQAVLSGKANRISTYYAVEMLNFTELTSARVYSNELRKQGAGGYIVNDKLYRVMAEIYHDKEDADNVCAKLNIDGYMARIYEIDIDDIDYKLLPTSVRNLTKSTMRYVSDVSGKLYDIGVRLASQNIDKSTAVAELKSVRATLANLLTDYESSCDNKGADPYVYKVRMQLGGALSGVDSLCSSSGGASELLSDIRYTNTMIVYTHSVLARDWAKVTIKDNK